MILSIPRLKAGAGLIYLLRGEQGSKEKGVAQRKIVVLRIPVVHGRTQEKSAGGTERRYGAGYPLMHVEIIQDKVAEGWCMR